VERLVIPRSYLAPEEWQKDTVQLSGREAHHLIHVLRVAPGAKLHLFDGTGQEATAVVTRVGRGEVTLSLEEKRLLTPPSWRITLAVAVPKQGLLDEIVNEATQLGVGSIVPLLTQRGVVRGTPDSFSKKEKRLAQIAIEAGKQSGVSFLPAILPATPLERWIPVFSDYTLVLMATVEGPHEKLTDLLSQGDLHKILLLIGPEGDFTEDEIRQATQRGAHRISLGPTILRCKTAALSALSILIFLLRERVPG
jgi:16S rRNA (uracil1498-N3)-methyltransferase